MKQVRDYAIRAEVMSGVLFRIQEKTRNFLMHIANDQDLGLLFAHNPALRRANAPKAKLSPAKRLRHKQQHIRGEMNKYERAHAAYLDAEMQAGHILRWEFERVTLRLVHAQGDAAKMDYTPDFYVVLPEGIELHEVKAVSHGKTGKKWTSARDDAKDKIKIAAALFPEYAFRLYEYEIKGGTVTSEMKTYSVEEMREE